MKPDKIIVTCSKGKIGKIICNHFRNEFEIIEIDKILSEKPNCYKVDISDFDTLNKTFELIGEVKCVIHLAASARPNASWGEVLKNNIIGTRNIYECTRLSKIPKVILASTCHTMGAYEQFSSKEKQPFWVSKITVSSPYRPDGDYATSKIFAESIARQYYEQFAIHSICLRIGGVLKAESQTATTLKYLNRILISYQDLIRLFDKSLQTNTEFGIYFGVSKNRGGIFDLSIARREIGFRPKDRFH